MYFGVGIFKAKGSKPDWFLLAYISMQENCLGVGKVYLRYWDKLSKLGTFYTWILVDSI